MDDDKQHNEITIRLISVYRKSENYRNTRGDWFQDFVYQQKDQSKHLPFMEKALLKNDLHTKKMFYSQPCNFLFDEENPGMLYYRAHEQIRDELKRAVWKIEVPEWAIDVLGQDRAQEDKPFGFRFCINEIEAFEFTTGLLVLSVQVEPRAILPNEQAPMGVKLLANLLSRVGEQTSSSSYKSIPFIRVFETGSAEHDQLKAQSAWQRFFSESTSGFSLGLAGEKIAIGDIFCSIINPDLADSVIADRYLCYSFLKTMVNDDSITFSEADYSNLIKFSRGQDDFYLPARDDCRPGRAGILKTFENIAFAVSAEGIAVWVKAKESQNFLKKQFKEQYLSTYFFMYLLSLHQRYGLAQLDADLGAVAPDIERLKKLVDYTDKKELDSTIRDLHVMRARVADFYLRYFFQQPVKLTNHQAFYGELKTNLAIESLLDEVEHTARELDYLIDSINKRQHLNFQDEQLEHMAKHGRLELTTTLCAELLAVSYYSYNVCHKALGFGDKISILISLVLTISVVIVTLFIYFQAKILSQRLRLYKNLRRVLGAYANIKNHSFFGWLTSKFKSVRNRLETFNR